CAGCEGSGRACVVSCARSPGATTPTPPIPTSSPATRASRAARSERQVVVLFTQRLGECLERLRLAVRRHLGSDLGPDKLARFAPPAPRPPTPAPPAPPSPGRKERPPAAADRPVRTSVLLLVLHDRMSSRW